MASEAGEPSDSSARRGLLFVLGSTVVAGGIGYVIQAIVPAFVDAEDYIAFSVFWSVVYLVVSGLSGIQQEVTRAARPGAGTGTPTLLRFALACAVGAAVVIVATSPLWATLVFAGEIVPLIGALAFAAVGYAFVAALSGALYGVRHWPGVAGMTVIDAVLRLAAVLVALALGARLAALGWAVALPFAIAATAVWLWSGRSIRRGLDLDTDLRGLFGNSARTVGAAIATGVMISGLPFILGITAGAAPPGLLASLILVITLTRAPLVIPLVALQSYLVVTFRDAAARVRGRVALFSAGMLAVTTILSALAVFVGPWVIALLYGDRYSLPPPAYAAIVASAGLTGVLCITGPAVLAIGRHTLYLLGWVVASLVTVGCLLLPLPELTGVLLALLAGPIAGIVVHAAGLARPAEPVSD